MPRDEISYSNKYCDDQYEYRHVKLPKQVAKLMAKNHLMTEIEWRTIGVQQSLGWVHYMIHAPGAMLDSTNCRKRKCGHTSNIRPKKMLK